MPSITDVASIVVASLALGVSIFQVRWAAREGRYNATFEHLRRVTEVLQRAVRYDLDQVTAEYLAFYRGGRDDLSPGAIELSALLTELDYLCLAIAKRRVDREITTTYLSSSMGTLAQKAEEVIRELRVCCGDPTVYADLGKMLPSFIPPALRTGGTDAERLQAADTRPRQTGTPTSPAP